ncbi:MAG: DUF5343 domain-containing protein [Candidatus Thorarchaeota archaeon]
MPLPDSYTVKPGSISSYFDAILNAEAPERFSSKYLESLDFKSTNDRAFIGILKEIKFLDADGVPTKRYFEFLDRSQSKKVLAEAIREAYSDLFTVNKEAHKLKLEEVKNKLRTLYSGSKKDTIIGRIASTFTALCEYADFKGQKTKEYKKKEIEVSKKHSAEQGEEPKRIEQKKPHITLDSLQYHINIVLPETRDQAVYDAIFKSLRDHLG